MTHFEKIFPKMSRTNKADIGRIACTNIKCMECPIQKECFGCLTERRGDHESFRNVSVHLAEWAMKDTDGKRKSRLLIAAWLVTGFAFGMATFAFIHNFFGG